MKKNFYKYMLALTVVLAVLKLTLWHALSWWWVFSPIWLPIAFSVTMIIIAILVALCFKGKPDEPMDMEDYIG